MHVYTLKGWAHSSIYCHRFVFAFLHPEAFSREDLAAALLNTAGQEIASTCYLLGAAWKLPRLVFCGGLVGNSPALREEISKYLYLKAALGGVVS